MEKLKLKKTIAKMEIMKYIPDWLMIRRSK
jgi:hypothetical protein